MLWWVFILLLIQPVHGASQQFRPADKNQVSRELLGACEPPDAPHSCWERFIKLGEAWGGDVNGDGRDELIVFPGTGGTGGSDAILYEYRNGSWIVLLDYFPYATRFHILPVTRSGYRDLCLTESHCFKWDRRRYVAYQAADYRRLSSGYFSQDDPADATLLWLSRYAGLKRFHFAPDRFSVQHEELSKDLERAYCELEDSAHGIRWMWVHKGGVWGIQGEEAFLLIPRPVYSGCDFKLQGDWILIIGRGPAGPKPQPLARYNRRTGELHILAHPLYWQRKIDIEP